MARLGLWSLGLLVVVMCVTCRADDLMMDEESAEQNVELVFLIHTSSKINKNNFQHYLNFMKEVIEKTNIDSGKAKVAAVTYRKNAKVAFNFNKFKTKAALLKGIGKIKASKSKVGNLASGLNITLTKLFGQKKTPANTKRWVIILTDANSGLDKDKIASTAKRLTDAGVKIQAFGIGIENLSQLQSVTTDVRGLKSYSEMGSAAKEVVRVLDTLQLRDEAVKPFIRGNADLAIVYHLSNNIKPNEIKFVTQFLKTLLAKASIDTGEVKVAFMNYAKRGRHQAEFSKHNNKDEVFAYLDKIGSGYRAAASNGGAALKEVQTKLFIKKAGDRPNAENVILLITDVKNLEQTENMFQVADELKNNNVKIITLGIKGADAKELKNVASQPQEKNSLFAQTYESVNSAGFIESVWRVVDPAAAAPIVPAPTAAPTRAATTTAPPAVITTTRVTKDIVTDIKKEVGDSEADIIFAVHFDQKGTYDDFEVLIEYLVSLVSASDVGGKKVRFGLYFNPNKIVFNLNDYSSINEIIDILNTLIKSNASATNLDLSVLLRDIRSKMFVSQKGDRPNVPNILIIFTDTVTSGVKNALEREKKLMDNAKIAVYGAGIGVSDKEALETISSSPNNLVTFSGYSELRGSHGNQLPKLIPAFQDFKEIQPIIKPRKEDYY